MSRDFDPSALRAFRDELARRHGGNAWSLVRELVAQSRAAGRTTVRLPRREPQPPTAPAPAKPAP